jgi:hypothetical protein
MTTFNYQGIPQNIQLQQVCLEEISISYNSSSVFLYTTEDFGTIGAVLQPNGFSNNTIKFNETTHTFDEVNLSLDQFYTEDYGDLYTPPNQTEDYGAIAGFGSSETVVPFGKLTLSGSAITQPNYRLYLSGQAKTKVVYSPDNTSGTLFEFGQKLERRTHAYNLSSIFDNQDDYGLISTISGLLDDYGLITESGPLLEYGLITENISGIVLPFGKLTLSGSAITQPNYRLYFSGSALEKFVHHPNNLSGTLFGFGQKIESITFDYNESSISENILDYGLVTNTVNQIDDYGNILQSSGSSAFDNYGLITEPNPTEPITYPFGKLTVSGSVSNIQLTNSEVGRGKITLSGELLPPNIDFTPALTVSGTINISGTSKKSSTKSYIGSGTLFEFGEKVEKVTYSYNKQSITVDSLDDFGLISEVSSESYDYGLISSVVNEGIDNYGRIVSNPLASSPFGKITLSGSSIESFDKATYKTSGSIFIFSGSSYAESFTANPPENTQLFRILGSSEGKLIYSFATFGGSLFSFGNKIERVTYDYNESSIVTNEDDYGLITNLDTQFSDYGFITDPGGGQLDDDYGLISQVVTSISGYPFGSLVISGTAIEKDIDSYVGVGTLTISSFARESEIETYNGSGSFFITGTAVEKDIDSYVGIGTITISSFARESEIETYNGSGSITLSGIATEKVIFNPLENTQLFQISGTAVEKDIDSYVGLGSLFIAGTAVEKDIDSYVGFGTLTISSFASESEIETYNGFGSITLSGIATEKFSANPPENTQLFQISGTAVEKDIDSFVGLGTIFISGELRHPNIDYTPHYGKDKNIGIGTTGIQLYGSGFNAYSANTPENTQLFQISGIATEKFSTNPPENTQLFQISGTAVEKDIDSFVGSGGTIRISSTLVEKDVDSYVGTGTIFYVSGQPLYSKVGFYRGVGIATFSGSALEKESEIHVGFGTISIDVFSRNYSPIYPRNTQVPGSGIGTIRINDDRQLTICRAVLPYVTRGTIFISGRGFESFSETNYPGTGLFTISGIASTREIAVYTAIGSGSITLSQSGVEKDIDSYVGSGSINISSSSINIRKNSYFGSGTITNLSGAAESISAQTPENTQLFQISGSATESYSAQTPETEVLYRFSGNIRERRTYGYRGTGQLNIGSSARTIFEPRVLGTGLFRFVTHVTDNLYDTCDSLDITCDYEHSASFRLVSNPPENTILFNISGSAVTKEIAVYIYNGSGTVGISGSVVLRKTKSFVGIGTLTISSISTKNVIRSYVGSGSITVLSGAAKSKTFKPPISTTLFVFSGSASTRTFKVKRYTGIGTAYFSGSASTKKLSRSSYSGIGTILLSGQLVYPNIKYVPAPKGFGSININGSSKNSLSHRYSQTFGTLFAFSGGFESFSRTKYIGIGTIYIHSTSASTINNPYQIPRVYVTII